MTAPTGSNPITAPHVLSTETLRTHFTALTRVHAGKPVAYFDGPGGTQIPSAVVEAMTDYLYHHNANTHWHYPTSMETDAAIARARETMADFFNCSPREVAFGNNMTTITFHIARALGRAWGPGDEVIVTELDHQANVAPWRALEKERGIRIRCVPFDPESGELVWSELERAVTKRTKLIAAGAASNALGTISPVQKIAALANAYGALCYVDAVHYAAHRVIDVKEMGCDFLACSAYKFYGPHAGVLFGKADVMASLDVPKLDPAPNEIPDRVETGTQNHEGIVGCAAAIEFLASLSPGRARREKLVRSLSEFHARGDSLFKLLWVGLTAIPGVRCFGSPPGSQRTPTIAFDVAGVPSADVAKALAGEGIFVSNGNFYATTVLERLGLLKSGLVRAGCACYTTEEEASRLINVVTELKNRG